MMLTRSAVRLLPAAVLLFATACQDLPEPTSPVDPSFNAQANPRAHTAQDLRAWFAAASPEVMALPQTVYASHDQDSNLLVFGVQNANAARGVQMALSRRGIPATAYRIEQAEPIEFMNTLTSRHRPTMGGLQIHFSGYVCTLGFNVAHSAGRSFITNSHCTANQGSTGNTAYYQPASNVDSSPIAFEAHDPSYSRIAGCSAGKVCRYSDAARALYVSGAESAQGVIAKTTGANNGSLSISGSFSVTSQDNSSTSFSGVVHKVGRTTGWSSGNVTSSCATVNVSGSNIQLLCQTLVQRSGTTIVQGGDSGSPVFRVTSGDNVQLVGILWGGSTAGDLFVFSPLKNIQDELGSFTATTSGSAPPPGDGGDDPPPGEEPPCVPRGNSGKCR